MGVVLRGLLNQISEDCQFRIINTLFRKDGRFSLRCLGGRTNYIIFYTEGCDVCAAEKQAAQDAVLRDRNIRVLLVNMDEIMENDPGLAGELMDSFDLSSLPLIIETDRKGIIRRRYLSLL